MTPLETGAFTFNDFNAPWGKDTDFYPPPADLTGNSMKNWMGCLNLALLILIAPPSSADSNLNHPYRAVPGLIDLRSTFSDGSHSIEDLVRLARSRGFKVLFIIDHERIALSYGVLPFRNILRYKKEYPSIMTHGPEKFLAEIDRVSKKYPDTIIIPGCLTSAFYYWTGSWFTKNLTAHEYDRKILILNFNKPEQYKQIPSVGGNLSFRYTRQLLPGMVLFVFPLAVGLILLKKKGRSRFIGLCLTILSLLAMIDYNPFRSSRFNPYHGDAGIFYCQRDKESLGQSSGCRTYHFTRRAYNRQHRYDHRDNAGGGPALTPGELWRLVPGGDNDLYRNTYHNPDEKGTFYGRRHRIYASGLKRG